MSPKMRPDHDYFNGGVTYSTATPLARSLHRAVRLTLLMFLYQPRSLNTVARALNRGRLLDQKGAVYDDQL